MYVRVELIGTAVSIFENLFSCQCHVFYISFLHINTFDIDNLGVYNILGYIV